MGKIIHIVLFKLKAKAGTPEHAAALESLANLLKVPGPISMHLGPPEIEGRNQGFDYGLYSVFEDRAALDKYAPSKEHQDAVANYVAPVVSDKLAYDWEISDKTGY